MTKPEQKKYKKILCIDGGGIKGVFPASLLTEIEKQIDGKIYEYFDLISGTSTGGIIALGLALGMTASEILHFYEKHGPEIFSGYKKEKFGLFSKLNKFGPTILGTVYDKKNLQKAIREVFDGVRIGNCKTRVLIPSVNINTGKIYIYKTSHHETLVTDYLKPVNEAALSTSAAPIYLGGHEGKDGNSFIDGGVGANNPSGMAVVEGLSKCGWAKEDIKLLSIGCMETAMQLDPLKAINAGRQYLLPGVLPDIFMNIESQYSEGIANLLLDDRYFRINFADANRRFEMDGATKENIFSMKGIGAAAARENCKKVIDNFFDVKAEPFEPYKKLI